MKNNTLGINLRYLRNLSRLSQEEVSAKCHFSVRSIVRWEDGESINDKSLRDISYFYSKEFNIPYELFRDGQALLVEDFEKLLQEKGIEAQSLRIKQERPNPRLNSSLSDLPSASTEQDLVRFLRIQESNSDAIPLSERSVTNIMRLIQTLKLNSSKMDSVIELFRHLGETSGQEKKD